MRNAGAYKKRPGKVLRRAPTPGPPRHPPGRHPLGDPIPQAPDRLSPASGTQVSGVQPAPRRALPEGSPRCGRLIPVWDRQRHPRQFSSVPLGRAPRRARSKPSPSRPTVFPLHRVPASGSGRPGPRQRPESSSSGSHPGVHARRHEPQVRPGSASLRIASSGEAGR